MPKFARVMGAVTAAYGAAIVASPVLLARPCRLTDADGATSWQVDALVRAVGVRDAASGAAILLAPSGRTLQLALAARCLADAGDAVAFGSVVPQRARTTVVSAAGGWAALNLLALLRDRRRS